MACEWCFCRTRSQAPCSRTELHARSTPHRGTEGRHGLGCKLPVPVLATCTTEFQTLDRPLSCRRPPRAVGGPKSCPRVPVRSQHAARGPARPGTLRSRTQYTVYTDEGSTRTLSSLRVRSDR
ncbi:hypothetical protein O6P43_035892 [Quillaja saponaria]|uniref:Uncharacterized protein n=1 Tax=Quillaja saponaria TaxID=32244 RepID=A0AAD7KJD5_QUISA|nr:hypothetical protein O6P43_035892 [Quillaja saponaria]